MRPAEKTIGQDQAEETGAPGWMVTFGDLTMLLLVFFILLFSFLTMDKVKYLKLQDQLEAISFTGKVERVSAAREAAGETAARAFQAVLQQERAATSIHQIAGHDVKIQRLNRGIVLTLGGELDPFDEGDWRLKDGHKAVLAEVKRGLRGKWKRIEVRGHTSANPRDSVVVEPGSQGRFEVRKFQSKDFGPGVMERANFFLLSWLRAEEVRKFLVEAHSKLTLRIRGSVRIVEDPIALKESLIRVRSEGYTRPLGPSDETVPAKDRAVNHRVEVVLTNEVESER